MKREIIKRIISWVVTIAIFLLGGYAVKEYVEDRNNQQQQPEETVSYELNTDGFSSVVAYGDTLDLSAIKIIKTENGTTTEIPFDASMVTAPVDTTRVGATMLKLSYAGQTFSVPVTVKYKIQFEVDGEVVETIHTLNSSELANIEAPQKEGYTFVGWSSKIPDILFENMNLVARYEAIIPALSPVEAVYGDKLADITLPSNAAGAWRFENVNADSTVGDAGKKTFDVSFVENGTNAVLKTDKLSVTVAKQKVTIEVFADFTYNGTRQEPTYQTSVAGLKVYSWLDGDKNYTDAGEYTYHFEIDDVNYVGEAKGTYVIKKATVTVKVTDTTMLVHQAIPKMEYQLSGFDGMSQEELDALVGITLIYPDSVAVGEYKIGATASNPSIELVVEEGTLTVNPSVLEGIGEPVLTSKVATYGQLISVIGFEDHPNGKWMWKNAEAMVGTVGKQVHVAVFVPSNSAFDPIEWNVEITVVPKQMVIEIVGDTTFDYDGSEHKVSFVVKDEEGNVRTDLVVLGNTPNINAGRHEITLTLEDPNYSATKVVTLTINKINPATDFTQIFNATWSATLKLSDIKLPAGYAWANPDKRIEKAGTASYAVIFTPTDTDNYNVVNGEFTVEVAKKTVQINNVENSYSVVYNGNAVILDRVTRPHEESKLEFVYLKDGKIVESMIDAGVYTVKITLPESDNYNLAEATTTVTILLATNTDNVNFSQTAIYGDLAQAVIKLPESTVGTWSIQGADATTTVGNFGENEFILVFTPANGNYNVRQETIKVTVSKKQINPPSLTADKRTQVYTGQLLTSGLQNGEGYVITDNGGINVGTYQVVISLASENYKWSDMSEDDKTISYSIIKAKNDWVVAPNVISWVYGQAGNAGTATAKGGELVVEYKPYGAEDSAYAQALPTKAGKYVARFTVTDSNYEDLVDTFAFEIKKQAINLPTYTAEYTYTGNVIKADIATSELYTVADSGHTNVGSYAATVTLVDSENYEWADDETGATRRLNYAITKADVDLTNLKRPNSVYGSTVVPTVDMKFNVKVEYRYADTVDGEYTTVVPTDAGTYYVKAIFEGNQNINADVTEPVQFVIEKAQANILGVREDKTYTTTYNGNNYNVTGVYASNGSELQFTLGAEPFTGVTNAGTYVVTITLPESDNYKGDSVDVTVVINRATNKESIKTSYSATYTNLVNNVITLPAGVQGTWSLKNVDETTTVGNVGQNTFVAVYTCTSGNYNDLEVAITVTVEPKKIPIPTVPANKLSQVYTGSTLTSGLQNGEGYVVVDDGGVYVGTYTVTVSLDGDNYIWSDGTTAAKTYTYKITPSENSEEIVTTYNAIYGTLLKDVVTLPAGVEGTWSIEGFDTLTVGNAGTNTFVAVFEPDEHGDYIRREVTITINVQKATVTAPTIALDKLSQIYTGNNLTSGLTVAEDSLYNIVDNGGTTVGTYYATLSLIDTANYKWDTTGKSDAIQLKYAIQRAQIAFTDGIEIEGWIYGATANLPTVGTNFPCDITFVYATAIDGTYATTVPTTAGTYYVKAIAKEDGNLIGAESEPVAFTIAKASVTINGGEDSYSITYGDAFELPKVSASNGANVTTVITKNGEIVTTIQGAGTYTVTYTVAEGTNFLSATRTVTVNIQKADVTISNLTIAGWTFGQTAKNPSAVANFGMTSRLTYKYYSDAECTDEISKPTNAGTYYVKAFFAGDDNLNAAQTAEAVSFTIAKQVVATPNVPNASVVYNGTKQYSGIAQSALYSISNDGNVNKGTYSVTLTLVDSANYAWNDVENDSKTVTVQYTITEGTNAISNVIYTANWTYGQTVSPFSAKATYGDIAIKYLVDGTETAVRPQDAGTYTVVFYTTDENCPIVSVSRTFTIAKATPVFSGADNAYTATYNGQAFVIPSVVSSSQANVTYTVKFGGETVTEIVGAGEYIITYSVEANKNYTAGTKNVTVIINSASISFESAPVIENWTFNEDVELPIVKVTQSFVETDEVYFEYRYSNDGGQTWTEWTRWGVSTFALIERSVMGVPTDAGMYELRARVEENVNYSNAATLISDTVTFIIEKADPTIDGVADGNIYTPTYTGNVYTVPGLSASYPGAPALQYAYTKNGAAVSGIVGAGTYTVTITLPESANYNEAKVEVTVTVQKADVTITKPTIQGWTYGQAAKNPSATATFNAPISYVYATAIDGEYTEAVPTNAGTYYVKAIFAGDDNLNAAESEATEFVIARAVATAPTASNKPYNKAEQTSGLTNGTGYVVKEDNGGKNVGTYTVTVALENANYIWADGTTADKVLSYKITPIDNEQSIVTQYNAVYGNLISGIVTLPTNEEGTWSIEGDPTTVGNFGSNTFKAVFTPDENGNYNSRSETITINVAKAIVPVPSYTNTYTYTGSEIAFEIQNPNWDLYEIGGHKQTNVGSYNATLTLKDSTNYVWEGNATLSYSIQKAQIVISNLAIDGWTYGDTAKAPTYTVTFADKCTVSFEYFDKDGNSLGSVVPTTAGTYFVKAKAIATDTHNLSDSEVSTAATFTIAKKNASITANATYTHTYTGNAYIIPGVTASHNEATLQYTVNGEPDSSIKNVGTYTVVITLPESTNYNKAEITVTVTVERADVIISDLAIGGWTYGETAKKPGATATFDMTANLIYKYATEIDGEYKDTVPTNAGNYYVKAIFEGNENLNEAESEPVAFTVAKATIQVPHVDDKEYTGSTITSGLTVTEDDKYAITEDNGGVELGNYTVTLQIKEEHRINYKWNSYDDGIYTITVTYSISQGVNSWKEGHEPAIDDWTYGEAGNTGTATPNNGELVIEYKVQGADDSTYTTTLPTQAGNYTARFTATDPDYKDLVREVNFTIKQKEVTVPTIAEGNKQQNYAKGETLTSGLVTQEGYVVTDEGGKNVGTYTVTVALENANYIWADGTSATKTYTYEIVAIDNTEEITTSYEATYGDLLKAIVTLPTGIEGAWSIEGFDTLTVGNAGSRTFKAVFAPANNNYKGREVTITIEVAKATVPTPEVTHKGQIEYTGNQVASGIVSTDLYTATDIGGVVVGKHSVQLVLKDKNNYKWSSTNNSDDIAIEYVEIVKAQNRDTISAYTAIYGQQLSDITINISSTTGTWSWQNATAFVGNAGEQKHILVFTPTDATNYEGREVEATVVVARASVPVPTIATNKLSQAYTGNKLTSGLTAAEDALYTIVDNGGTNVGTYYVTLSLKDTENYVWADDTSADKVLSYKITPIDNTEEIQTSYEATYGDLLMDIVTLPVGVEGTWSIEGDPTTVGNFGSNTFKAVFTPDENGNYNSRSVTITIAVAKASVTISGSEDRYSEVYTGQAIVLPSITTSNNAAVTTVITKEGVVVEAILGAGTYTVTYTVAESDNYLFATKVVTYTVEKADVTISKPTIENWTYGDTANTPSVTTNFVVDVTFKYYTDAACTKEITTLVDANTYYVKAFFAGDENLNEAESAATEFAITKKEGNWITGVEDGDRFTGKVYRGSAYQVIEIITSLGKAHTETAAFSYVYTKDGETVNNILNAGEYTVVITLADSKNYKQVGSVTVTVVIEQVANVDIIPEYAPVYGTLLNSLVLPTHSSNKGTWSWQGATETTTVGNAGEQTHVLFFKSTDPNYADRTVEVTMNVAKAPVTINGGESSYSIVYTGNAFELPSVSASNGATVNMVIKKGETIVSSIQNAGAYTVTYTVAESDNYLAATRTVSVTVTEASVTITDPTIDDWTYGQAASTPNFTVSKDFTGDVTVIIEYSQNGQSWTETVPTNAGNYKVRVRVERTDNYNGYTTNAFPFTIKKATVNVPTYTDKYTYTGGVIEFIFQENAALYTISGHDQTNAGTYTVTFALVDDDNYKWNTTDESDPIEFSYKIQKATVTIKDLAIEGWTYGQYDENVNKPTYTVVKPFTGNIRVTIEYSTDGDAWSETVPENAGNYFVRVKVVGTDNYIGDEAIKEFAIAKAPVTINGVENSYSPIYNGEDFTLPSVSASNGATVNRVIKKGDTIVTSIQTAGTYTVIYTVAEGTNFLSATRTVTVTVQKANVTISKPAIQGWTYGQAAKNPSATATFNAPISYVYATAIDGEYTEAVPTNAGTYYVKAFFAGDENLNGAESEATEFVIAKVSVNVPPVSNKPYNKAEQTSGLTNETGYVVKEDNGGKNVGTYNVVVSLVSNNYVWADGTSEDKTLTYEITAIENTQDVTTSYTATYGDLISGIVTLPTHEEGTWSIEGDPTTVGEFGSNTFTVVYTSTTGNYNSRSETITINVAKATVNVPTYTDKYTYTGGEITVDIPTSTLYNIAGHKQTAADTYTATLKLTDSKNYKWDGIEGDTVTLEYEIEKGTISNPQVVLGDWTFNQAANTPSVNANITVAWTYKYATERDGDYSETVPTNAGTYYVKAFFAGDDNVYAAETAVATEFKILKADATISNVANEAKDYRPEGFSIANVINPIFSHTESTPVYTIGGSLVSTTEIVFENVGEYLVEITLPESANYKEAIVNVKITINPAKVVITNLAISGWTYGESAKAPTCNATFTNSDRIITYVYADAIDGEYTSTVPTNAGTYYVKAIATALSSNIEGAESDPISFTIAKANVSVSKPSIEGWTYGESAKAPSATATWEMTANLVYKYATAIDGEYKDTVPTNAGTYYVKAFFAGNENLNNAESEATEFVIAKVQNTDTIPANYTADYGTLLNTLPLPVVKDTTPGEWSWKGDASTTVGVAGTQKHTLIFTPTDATNYEAREVEVYVTVNVRKVSVPNLAALGQASFVYDGNVKKPTLVEDYYTVTYNTPNSTNVGEYTITLTLKDTVNSQWDVKEGDTTAPRTLTYNIAKAKAEITPTQIGTVVTTYTGSAINPANFASTNVGANALTWTITKGGTAVSSIKDVGTYIITYSVAGTSNYDAAVDVEVTVDIGRAKPTWDDIFTGNKFYQNMLDLEVAKLVAKNASGETVEGTFTFTSSFNATAGASTITVTFTPDNQTNYQPTTVDYDITLVAVAKIDSTYYGTIEKAIEIANVANKTVVVWVCPFDAGLAAKGQYPTIKTNITINQSVTLLLPYGANGSGKNTFDNDGINFALHGGTDYDANGSADGDVCVPSYGVNGYCYVKVIVAQGVIIQNNGTIEIAAELSSGNGGAPYNGHVGGQYAELLLDTDAKIICGDPEKGLNGTIRAAGYISEVVGSTNSQVIINKNSVIWMPYVVRDFQGGSFSYAIQSEWGKQNPITAFNRFVMMNVSPLLTIHQGGKLNVWAGLYASDQHNRTAVSFVGGSDAVIELTQSDGYLTAKYNPKTEVCDVHIYGGATTHPMKLKVDLKILGFTVATVDITTESCFFPISYHQNVTLHKTESQTEAVYTMSQRFKLLPGASFTVEPGVKVIANTFVIYTEATPNADGTYSSTDGVYNGFLTANADGGTVPAPYPSSTTLQELGITEERSKTGILTIKGQMVCDVLAGKVYSQGTGASVIINNATTYRVIEAKTHEGSSTSTTITSYNKFDVAAELINGDGTVVTPALGTTYAYANGVWKQPVVHISFNADGGNGVGSIGVPFDDGIYQGLPTPTRKHYTFVRWKDANGNTIVDGTALPADCVAGSTLTLTAEWKLTEYTLQYQGVDKDGNSIAWTMDSIKFKLGDSYSLPTITPPTGYTHLGWKFNGKNITSLTIDDCLAAVDAENQTITVQALFESSDNTYTYNFVLGDKYPDLSYSSQNWPLGTYPNSTDHPELMKQIIGDGVNYETSPLHQFYFEGWYTDAEFTRVYDKTYQPTEEEKANKTITLYAKWGEKVSLTFNANKEVYQGLFAELTSSDFAYGTAYWFKPGTIMLPDLKANDGITKGDTAKYYFISWTLNGAELPQEGNASYTLLENAEVNIVWGDKVLFQLQVANATITLNGDDSLKSTSSDKNNWTTEVYYCKPNTTVNYSITFGATSKKYAGVISGLSAEPGQSNMKENHSSGSFVPDGTKKVAASSGSNICLAAGTLVTLADGTVKKIEDVLPTDILLAFDHETGKLVATEIMLIEIHDGWGYYDLINLRFSNGTVTRIINEHGFFNKTLNKYVYITPDNYNDFIGHEFVVFNGDEADTVILEEAFMTYEYTGIYNIVTKYQLNCISDGLLSMSGGMEGTINIFEYDENMKYDEEKMQADIEKYGLFTYEDFSAYVSEDVYNMFPAAYFKVAVGKGHTTYEELLGLVLEYLVKHGYVTP